MAALRVAAAAWLGHGAFGAPAAAPAAATAAAADQCQAGDDRCVFEGTSLLQHGAMRRMDEDSHLGWPKAWPKPKRAPPKKPTGPIPHVDAVYTFGAPATKAEPFRNAAHPSGCFPGLRSYTEDLLGAFGEIHQVDAAAMNNYYPHAWTNSVVLHWDSDSYYTPCDGKTEYGHPEWPQRGGQVYEEWRLHQEDDYTDRLNEVTVDGKKVADQEPFASARKFVLLAFKSYDTVKNTNEALAEKMPDWKLVSKVVSKHGTDTDPVMIVQHQRSMDCAFVFTGTNDGSELSTSTTQYGTGYCGFEEVHVGYRNELWTMTGDMWNETKPVLESCNKVICVGHSLGGALCEIFAACANSGNTTDPDYQRLAWTPRKAPRRMAEINASKSV